MNKEITEHRFGGPWTEIKLKALRDYLHFYTQALKGQSFSILYIDAFAGTGDRTVDDKQPPLFASERRLKGSARIALDLERPFDHYIFIEQNLRRFQVLEALRRQYSYSIECLRGDANYELKKLCARTQWGRYRAVLFLDPYGLSVEWSTLQKIASTKAIDLWYLFSLSGLYRQTAHDFERIDPTGAARLDSVLGTPDWREAFYAQNIPNNQADLFGEPIAATFRRHADVNAIEAFVKERLSAAGFSRVTDPLRLLSYKGAPLYSLFFALPIQTLRLLRFPLRALIMYSKQCAGRIWISVPSLPC